MWRLFAISCALLLTGIVCLAQVPTTGAGKSGPAGGSGGYTGLGDVLGTNWFAHYGTRAFSSARRGQKLWNVCDATGANCVDWSSDATTGAIVPTLINGSSCGVVTCPIHTWYDDSGLNSCGGAPCNFVQTTVADMATVSLSA